MKKYRQGDILFRQVEKLPERVKEIKNKTVAYGEVTGHSHRFSDDADIKRYKLGDRLFLQVFSPATIIHNEHLPFEIDKGIYEQIQEREYDPFEKNIRAVVD